MAHGKTPSPELDSVGAQHAVPPLLARIDELLDFDPALVNSDQLPILRDHIDDALGKTDAILSDTNIDTIFDYASKKKKLIEAKHRVDERLKAEKPAVEAFEIIEIDDSMIVPDDTPISAVGAEPLENTSAKFPSQLPDRPSPGPAINQEQADWDALVRSALEELPSVELPPFPPPAPSKPASKPPSVPPPLPKKSSSPPPLQAPSKRRDEGTEVVRDRPTPRDESTAASQREKGTDSLRSRPLISKDVADVISQCKIEVDAKTGQLPDPNIILARLHALNQFLTRVENNTWGSALTSDDYIALVDLRSENAVTLLNDSGKLGSHYKSLQKILKVTENLLLKIARR